MTIWEAYCDIKLRNSFKHEYLAAQGMTPAKAQDAMTKFKVYIDRFNGIPDVIEIRRIETVDEMINKLDYIFCNKWQNNIKDNYRIMPELFKQYGRYLQAENARREEPLFPNDKTYLNHSFSGPIKDIHDWDKPYIDNNGKLRIIANPEIISILRKQFKERPFDEKVLLLLVQQYYCNVLPKMNNTDWQKLIQALFGNDKKKNINKTGAKKSKIHLVIGEFVDQVMQPSVALEVICNYVGNEKVATRHFEINGLPLLTKSVPLNKDRFFCQLEDGWFLNSSGDTKDKVKMIRMIASIFHIDVKTEIVIT